MSGKPGSLPRPSHRQTCVLLQVAGLGDSAAAVYEGDAFRDAVEGVQGLIDPLAELITVNLVWCSIAFPSACIELQAEVVEDAWLEKDECEIAVRKYEARRNNGDGRLIVLESSSAQCRRPTKILRVHLCESEDQDIPLRLPQAIG